MDAGGWIEKALAGRWIAGPTIEDAIGKAKSLNRHHIRAILNYLGEAYNRKENVDKAVASILELMDAIGNSGVKADVAVKGTQLGMLLGWGALVGNYRRIVREGAKRGITVWLDMEEHKYVTKTVRLYLLVPRRGRTGICIQSYLKRSISDMKNVTRHGGMIRLVKGAYTEPESVAFQSREETTGNYYVLMDYLFRRSKRFTIATHDEAVVRKALELNKKYGRDVTYAMLNGIRGRLARELAQKGEKVSVYVPFGREWIPYSYRRLKEASNLKLVVRSIFERGL